MRKAIALLSGGLDSILAARLILEQGIELEAVNFLTVFCNCTTRGKTCLASRSAADALGIKLKVFEISREYFEVVKNPGHGYGSNMNPCLDCRIFMFKKAGEYMKATGASFLVTGEVLGERPMSQKRRAMRIIEKESNLEGLILRPLSAGLLEPTLPEKRGWIDRERLMSIRGRSRKPQIELARELGVGDYPCPAGGCLLTYKEFANKMRDLIRYKPDFTANDVRLLKLGRHFRLAPEVKLIVGRNQEDNERLLTLVQENDLQFFPTEVKGPIGIGRGLFNEDYIHRASCIIARYSDGNSNQPLKIAYRQVCGSEDSFIIATPSSKEELDGVRI